MPLVKVDVAHRTCIPLVKVDAIHVVRSDVALKVDATHRACIPLVQVDALHVFRCLWPKSMQHPMMAFRWSKLMPYTLCSHAVGQISCYKVLVEVVAALGGCVLTSLAILNQQTRT